MPETMPLASGTKLGPYEIQSPLGAGGMGEVYRARDTRLERTVAIKILPPQLSNDPLRKQRFEREAKTISNLNHPHICVLHDVQVWLHDLSQETLTRFTFEGNRNLNSVWTPDGKRIAFNSNKEGPPQSIFRQLADGSGGPERLTGGQYARVPMSWSPDGRWLAYISNESGRYEVYVQPYPGPGGKSQISTEGGTEPAWNSNGRELCYRSGDKMMAVEIATQPSFTAGKPRMLFEGRYVPSPATAPNWFEELKRRVPTGKNP
jgi:hypothetical protein